MISAKNFMFSAFFVLLSSVFCAEATQRGSVSDFGGVKGTGPAVAAESNSPSGEVKDVGSATVAGSSSLLNDVSIETKRSVCTKDCKGINFFVKKGNVSDADLLIFSRCLCIGLKKMLSLDNTPVTNISEGKDGWYISINIECISCENKPNACGNVNSFLKGIIDEKDSNKRIDMLKDKFNAVIDGCDNKLAAADEALSEIKGKTNEFSEELKKLEDSMNRKDSDCSIFNSNCFELDDIFGIRDIFNIFDVDRSNEFKAKKSERLKKIIAKLNDCEKMIDDAKANESNIVSVSKRCVENIAGNVGIFENHIESISNCSYKKPSN